MIHIYKYEILTEYKLIIQAYSGKVGFPDLIAHKFQQKKDKLFDASYNHIVHMLDAQLEVTAASTEKYVRHVNQSSYLYEYEKSAFILSNRNQAIKGLLAQGKIQKKSHLRIDLCVSVQEAVTKLGLEKHMDAILREFNDLVEVVADEKKEMDSAV